MDNQPIPPTSPKTPVPPVQTNVNQAPTPPTPPTPPNSSLTPNIPKRKSRKSAIVAIIVILIILIAIGAGAAWYYQQKIAPYSNVKAALTQLENAKTLSYDNSVTVTLENFNAVDTIPAGIKSFIPYLRTKNQNEISFKSSATLDTTLPEGLNIENSFTIENLLGYNVNLTFDQISLGDSIYIKLINLPSIPLIDISFLDDVWIKIDINEVTALLPQEIAQQVRDSYEQQKNQQQQLIQKLSEVFAGKNVREMLILSNNRVGEINDITVNIYDYTLDKEVLRPIIKDIGNTILQSIKKDDSLSSIELPDIMNIIDLTFDSIDTINGTMWIGKDGNVLQKETINVSLTTNDKLPVNNIFVQTDYTNIGNPVSITQPDQYKTISDVTQEVMGKLFLLRGANEITNPTDTIEGNNIDSSTNTGDNLGNVLENTDTDNDGLTDAMEITYGTDPENPDSDGDGFLDGEEVANGYNPNGPGKLKQ